MRFNLQELVRAPLALTEEAMLGLLDLYEFQVKGIAVSDADALSRLPALGGKLTEATYDARASAPDHASSDGSDAGVIGVINISGVIAPAAYLGWSGGTAIEDVRATFHRMLGDARIKAVVLNVDSPGGVVYGTQELASEIAAARGAKPIVAFTPGMMASAAYWLGSAADTVVAAPSAEVGSIGVRLMHVDISRALQNFGVGVSMIKAGKYKVEGSPFAPLSDEARAALQGRVDEYYDAFVAGVAANRDDTPAKVRAGYGEGRVLSANKALGANLIDQIGTFESVLAGLATELSLPNSRRRQYKTRPLKALAETATLSSATLITTTNGMITKVEAIPVAFDAARGIDTLSHQPNAARAAGGSVKDDETPEAATQRANEDRSKRLIMLAKEHGKPLTWYETALGSGKSVETVQAELLADYRAAQEATAVHAGGNGVGAQPKIAVGKNRAEDRPWGSAGLTPNADFLMSVKAAGDPSHKSFDERLLPLGAASGMSQGVLSEGGFAVPAQFASTIWDRLNASPDNLLGMTDQYTVEGDYLEMPRNPETSRATGSRYGGIRGYWINEADQITKSKPKLGKLRLEPNQLAVLVYLTEKLLNNATALEQYVTRAASDEILFLTGQAIFAGTGAGQPLGWLNSPCKVEVAKETGQAGVTFNQENVAKMHARLHPYARKNAKWFMNVDVEPQLDLLNSVVKNVAGTENVGGYANKVYDSEKNTLKGKPIVFVEYAETLGTAGDIVLCAPDFYATGVRGRGIEFASSIHVRFEYAEQAFRFMYECDGQPWLADKITPFKGANTLSSIVTLATRA